jgi:hypothetical protein
MTGDRYRSIGDPLPASDEAGVPFSASHGIHISLPRKPGNPSAASLRILTDSPRLVSMP